MNWRLLVRLLLNIASQTNELLISIVMALSSWCRARYDQMQLFVSNMLDELKYIGQTKAMQKLINDKYDPLSRGIFFVDGTITSVTFWGGDNSGYEVIAGENYGKVGNEQATEGFIAVPDEATNTSTRSNSSLPTYISLHSVRLSVRQNCCHSLTM